MNRWRSILVASTAIVLLGTSSGCIAPFLADVFFAVGPLLL